MNELIKAGEIIDVYKMLPSYMVKTEKKCPKCKNPLVFNRQTKEYVECCYEYNLGKNEMFKQLRSKENEVVTTIQASEVPTAKCMIVSWVCPCPW